MCRSSPQPVSLHEECALFRLSRAVSSRFDPLRLSDFFRSPDRFAGRCPEDQTASISRRSSDFLPDSRSFGLFPDFRHLPLSPDIIHRNKKLRRSSPAARRTIPEAVPLNRSRTYEINILSILKIRKQSQHPIFSPNPSASDQISPPKKKKRHGKRRSENAVLPSGLFPM